MSIPIQNIYYLLCYAWGALEQKDRIAAGTEDFKDLSDLFAKVLASGTMQLFKRGIDQGYCRHEDDSRSIRGKLLLGPSIQRLRLQQVRAVCAFDERTANVLHNQVLRATMRRLLACGSLDFEIRKELDLVYRRFPPVDDIVIQTRHFNQIRLTRNNQFYRFLLDICRIVHEHWIATEGKTAITFNDFIRDERKMRLLFQAFVRNFYDRELSEQYKVSAEKIKWHISKPGAHDDRLPEMRTDICLRHRETKKLLVIDTKFESQIFQHHHDAEKVSSKNLYQIFSYLRNMEATDEASRNCSGMLLYAAADTEADLHFNIAEHDLRVCTLNLAQEWRDIDAALRDMVS